MIAFFVELLFLPYTGTLTSSKTKERCTRIYLTVTHSMFTVDVMFTCTFLTWFFFFPFIQAAKSIDDVLDQSIIASPLILRYGDNRQQQQFFIIYEKEVIVEVFVICSSMMCSVCCILCVRHGISQAMHAPTPSCFLRN